MYPNSLIFSSSFTLTSTTMSNTEFLAIKNFKSKLYQFKLDLVLNKESLNLVEDFKSILKMDPTKVNPAQQP